MSESPGPTDPPPEDVPTELASPTPNFLRQAARWQGRRDALKWAASGAVAVGVNVVCMMHDGEYYPLLMFGVPCLLMGLAGMFFPLDYAEMSGFWSRKPDKLTMPGTDEPVTVGQIVLLVAMIGGLVLGIYLAINPTAPLSWFGLG